MAEKADVGEAVGLAGTEQMLDGNAAAGLLQEVFGTEMTANPVRCAHCDQVSMIGELMAFGREVGTVLRCPHCSGLVLRAMEAPDALWLDLRGAASVRIMRDRLIRS